MKVNAPASLDRPSLDKERPRVDLDLWIFGPLDLLDIWACWTFGRVGPLDIWKAGPLDPWIWDPWGDGCAVGRLDPCWTFGPLDPWTSGLVGPLDLLDPWTFGFLEPWTLGPLDAWFFGPLDLLELWALGPLDLWAFGWLRLWTFGSLDLWTCWTLGLVGPLNPWTLVSGCDGLSLTLYLGVSGCLRVLALLHPWTLGGLDAWILET